MANNTISISGGGAGAGSLYTVTGSSSTWTSHRQSSTIELSGPNADIILNGRSLMIILDELQERLMILEPKPELLEKYQALKAAYDHYKILEALLYEETRAK